MKSNQWILVLVLPLLFGACVSSKKYKELETKHNSLNLKYNKSQALLKGVKGERDELDGKLRGTTLDLTNANDENKGLQQRIITFQNDYNDLEGRYNNLLEQNKLQLANASSATQRLNEILAQKETELVAKAKTLRTLEGNLNASKKDLAESKALLDEASNALALREKRLNELEAILKQQEEKTAALRKTISNALLGFKESDLTVEEKNGKVYVSLSQNLLFASGSTTIDKSGYSAIKKIAEVLSSNTDIDIMVEGHTDNVPFRGRAGMRDNWDLSVIRSTSLVRELIKNGVDSKRIIASGRGEFFPVSDNDTKDGKAKNRRSEIILSPKLDELYNLIKE
jgi:chemotaxis protein MotB